MTIGITDNFRPKQYFDNYLEWLHRIDPTVEFTKLSYHLNNGEIIKEMDALLLTGGGDVHPSFYGKPEYVTETVEVNERRDEFEFGVIEKALEADIPILGICRGMQVMNVCLGGSLIVDLPAAGYKDHSEKNGNVNLHSIEIVEHSMIGAMHLEGGARIVNSAHHQAVDELGRGLMASAESTDGVIEAAEWILKGNMPFLLLVQWHPERMKDFDNPCCKNIAERFLREVTISITNRQ